MYVGMYLYLLLLFVPLWKLYSFILSGKHMAHYNKALCKYLRIHKHQLNVPSCFVKTRGVELNCIIGAKLTTL